MFHSLSHRAESSVVPWVISASSDSELSAHASSVLQALDSNKDDATVEGVGAALAAADTTGPYRAVVCGASLAELRNGLSAVAAGRPHPGVVRGSAAGPASVAFVYPGQGAQWPGMTLDLIAESPVYRAAMSECGEAFARIGGVDLEALLREPEGSPLLRQPDLVQPALFAIEASLSRLWASFGVVPDAMVGHSMGDVAAAYTGGGVELADAARVIAEWSGAMMPLVGRGDMASVAMSAEEVERRRRVWADDVVVAGIISPRSVLLAGAPESIARRVAELSAEGIAARIIEVGMAAHGPQAQDVYAPTEAVLGWFAPGSGTVPFYSGLTGDRLDTREMTGRYWADNFRNTIRFDAAVRSCLAQGIDVCVEVSPHPVLIGGVEQTVEATGAAVTTLHTMRRRHGGLRRFLEALAQAYTAGVPVDWTAAFTSASTGRFPLPELAGRVLTQPALAPMPAVAVSTPGATADGRRSQLERLVVAEATAVLGSAGRVDPAASFLEAGFDSALAVELVNRLRVALDRHISVVTIFDHPTPRELAAALADPQGTVPAAALPTAGTTLSAQDDPVVVVGVACRLPGAVGSPEQLWALLAEGGDAIGPLPDDRGWDVAALTHPDGTRPGTSQQTAGGFLADATSFDPEFFRMSPREALATDPQQRLLLEVAWEALERAHIPPTTLRGTRTGVFAGVIGQEYGPRLAEGTDEVGGYLFTGTTPSVASGRLAYTLGLEGPALSVDTACSSSLVAILLACRSLAMGETDLALAGGVTVMPGPGMLVDFSKQGVLAADGRCKAFSADADGFGMAEGAGMLVLEKLSDARRRGHPVLAVLRGGAMNSDGASNGLSAPNGRAQREVIERALADSALRPSDVDVVEAHGTGTRLGDPIEAQALAESYGSGRAGAPPLWLGSVKSNLGHTQAAAGVTGVIKMILALRNEMLPSSLHVREPSREVAWADSGLRVLTESVPWPKSGTPRRAGVSSFGISGTNAHLIVEEAPGDSPQDAGVPSGADVPAQGAAERSAGEPDGVPLVVTGAGHDGLRRQAARLAAHLRDHPELRLADLGHSLAVTRAALGHRIALAPRDRADALRLLDDLAAGTPTEPVYDVGRGGRSAVFVFPGQGWQWAGMGVELLQSSPVFARAMADCDRALAAHTGFSVIDELREQHARGDQAPDDRVERVQPALFAMMVSLAALWQAHGVRPSAVVGHSQGEIAAACVAGALSLDEAARLVAVRSGLLAGLRGRCGMGAVALGAEAVEAMLADRPYGLVVAAVNGPRSVVVAGPGDELDGFLAECDALGIRVNRLPVDYASHSPQIEEIRPALQQGLGRVEARSASVPFYSTVRGEWTDGASLDEEYWYANLREPVAFEPSIRSLAAAGHPVFLEISAHPVLCAAVEESAGTDPGGTVAVGSLRRGLGQVSDFYASLARLHAAGVDVEWGELYSRFAGQVVELPTYAFQRRRVWLEPAAPAAGRPDPVDALQYHIEWRAQRLSDTPPAPGTWLVVRGLEDHPVTAAARDAVTEAGGHVVELVLSPAECRRDALAAWLRAEHSRFDGVLSALAVDDTPADPASPMSLPSLGANLALLQALLDLGASAPLWCLTTSAVATTPAETVPEPAASGLWGLGRVAALEHPELWGGLIDVPANGVADVRRHLAAVLSGGEVPEDEVALRGGRVLARRWVRSARQAPTNVPEWTPTGTVLVTGGTGGIGQQVVRWLAGIGAAHILVVSRRGRTADGVEELVAEVEALGSAITVASCDVSDRDQLAGLIGSIDPQHPLTAVFHTAAGLDDALIEHLGPEQVERAARSKVLGAKHLHELTAELDLSAFVLFSSFASAFGAPGLGSYAPGNAYLDALARRRRAEGLVATSVAWGTWAGSGMAEGPVGERFRRHGVIEMSHEHALRALRNVIDGPETCPVVIDIAWDRFLEAFTAQRRTRLFDDLPEAQQRLDAGAATASPMAGLPPEQRARACTDLVRRHAAEVLGYPDPEQMPTGRAFRDAGFDSLASVELRNRLSAATGLHLPPTVVFDHPDVAALARHLSALLGVDAGLPEVRVQPQAPADEPIAIVGMACRFPGGIETPDQLWEFVLGDGDTTGEVPEDRGWNIAGLLAAGASTDRPRGSFLDDAAGFDAAFFGVSPREALAMDPQQRLVLEATWEALEGAGIRPGSLRGSDTGVFLGMSHQGYGAGGSTEETDEAGVAGYLVTGTTASVASGRIAYVLGLEGPALTVDTACSSSLVTLHLACGALRAGDCSLAVAGGVSVMASPDVFTEFSRQGALAQDGRCKPYAADADGFGLSEGVALLVVERLSEARRRGHRVLAVVAGSAVNSDGASNGLTAPNGRAQERVIRQAWDRAGVSGEQVDVVEGHGTGTRLGDPVEVSALVATYGRAHGEASPVLLGSVKSNIGHAQAAAGAAGLIKMVLALRHGMVPGMRCPGGVSELVDWQSSGIEVVTGPRPWTGGSSDGVRRAGVSAFGVSGTNAHVIIAEAPADAEPAEPAGNGVFGLAEARPLVLSARTPAALREAASDLAGHLTAHSDTPLPDVSWTLAMREPLEYRAALVVATADEAVAALRDVASGEPGERAVTVQARERDRVVFVFPGQGSQWRGMALELLDQVPAFAEAMAECDAAVSAVAGFSVLAVLRGEVDTPPWDRVDVIQPVLFAVMVSLARTWQACGVTPAAVIGHSQGEIAAACVAGALSLADAARVVVLRSRTLRALAGLGTMLHIALSRDAVIRLLSDGDPIELEVAAVNGPASVVVAGDLVNVARAEARCAERGVNARRIPVDYASHTAQIEQVREEYAETVGTVTAGPCRIPLFSTTRKAFVEGPDLDAEYWYANLRGTVEFDTAVRSLLADGHDTFIEVSPHPVLAASVQDIAVDTGAEGVVVLDTLRRDDGAPSRFLGSLAQAHAQGMAVDWAAICGTGRHVSLPGYPFQRQQFWLRPTAGRARDEIADWFYDVTWTRFGESARPALRGEWLVVVPSQPADAERIERWLEPLCAELTACGATPRKVSSVDAVGERPPAGVLSLLGLDSADGATSTLAMLRSLAASGSDVPLWVLTTGAVSTGPADPVRRPSSAQLWGLGMAAALERGTAYTGVADLPESPDAAVCARLVAALAGTEDQIAVRADGLWGRRLRRRHRPAAPRGGSVVPGGTILVTGGVGGLGAEIARWLARHGAEHIALASRRGAAADGVSELVADLERLGARVSVHACNVTSRDAVQKLVDEVSGTGEAIRGVVHAAGLPQRTPVAEMSDAAYETVVAPKMLGAWHLHECCPDAELFLLFSSGAGVWGSGEQGGYAAGNAVLDAFAHYRRSLGLPATSVAWGLWRAGGMTADVDAVDRLIERGMSPMPQEHALDALERVLTHGDPTAVVADITWPAFVEGFAAARERPLLADIAEARVTAPATPAAEEAGWADRLAGLPPAQRRTELVRLVASHVAAVLGHEDPGTVPVSTAFSMLGFDSLAAVRMRNRLAEATGLRLSATLVFDQPNVTALASYLDGELTPPAAGGDVDTAVRVIESALGNLSGPARAELVDRVGQLVSAVAAADTGRAVEPASDEALADANVEELLDALDRELNDR
ncbi:Erythronolide synthase, modules 1 and 2 [Streptomyces noursei ATCC 11455]|uniref:type I polyketide synthase n=1 Tax=Streptomyces noursei TaxID=1971 RepID=UPI00081CA98D|nr:Erythronolide synthase, modules 1 and 2 [Streptomyces noursei ATCC 11455]